MFIVYFIFFIELILKNIYIQSIVPQHFCIEITFLKLFSKKHKQIAKHESQGLAQIQAPFVQSSEPPAKRVHFPFPEKRCTPETNGEKAHLHPGYRRRQHR